MRGVNRIGLIRIYAHILPMKGTYLIVMQLQKDTSIKIGKQCLVNFHKGYYAYIGSALNGLDQRIQRHLRKQKKIHWHIDYFLLFTEIVNIFYKENTKREECKIAHLCEKNFTYVPGFGCNDCFCKSHLFYGSFEKISKIANDLQMKPYLF